MNKSYEEVKDIKDIPEVIGQTITSCQIVVNYSTDKSYLLVTFASGMTLQIYLIAAYETVVDYSALKDELPTI